MFLNFISITLYLPIPEIHIQDIGFSNIQVETVLNLITNIIFLDQVLIIVISLQ